MYKKKISNCFFYKTILYKKIANSILFLRQKFPCAVINGDWMLKRIRKNDFLEKQIRRESTNIFLYFRFNKLAIPVETIKQKYKKLRASF